MVIIFGTRLMGKVDKVDTLGHVATQFFHVYYVPLIPTGSYLVFQEQGDDFRGLPISLSFKSILAAWLRAGLFLGFVALTIGCAISLADGKGEALGGILLGVLGAAALGLFMSTYWLGWFSKASFERAMHLAQTVGLNEEGLLMLEIAYGRKTAEQADWELQQIETRREAETVMATEIEPQ